MYEMLTKLGLSDKEARVYLAALELGEDTVQNIAKKAKVNRATTYVILEKLMKLGLASTHQEEKKTVFVAEDPHELANILEDEKKKIDERRSYLDDAMKELMAIYNARRSKPSVRYFEGADGLEVLDRYGMNNLKPGTEMVGVIPIDTMEAHFPARRRSAVNDRVKLGIHSRVIYTHKDGPIPDYVNKEQLREGIFLERESFPIDISMQIFPEWGVKFYNLGDANYFGILIESPDIARNLIELYELAWEGAQARAAKANKKEA